MFSSTPHIVWAFAIVASACAFSRPPRPPISPAASAGPTANLGPTVSAELDADKMSEDKLSQLLMDQLREGLKQDLKARPDLAKELDVPLSEEGTEKKGSGVEDETVEKATGDSDGGKSDTADMDEVMGRVRDLQNQFQQLPKALKELLWGNESAVPTKADLSDLLLDSSRTPASGMQLDEQVACVVKCDVAHDEMQASDFGCEQLNEGLDCLAKCRPGAFADYSYQVAKRMRTKYCSFEMHPDHATSFDLARYRSGMKKRAQQCANSLLADKLKVLRGVNHFVSCYIEMEEAANAKEACYALKYCVLESTAERIADWCKDPELGEAMKSSSVHSMTLLSANGNLIRQCPALYETTDF